jgi:hypothetical protein
MATEAEGRHVIRIAVSPGAKAAVENFAKHWDMKEMGVASRMYEWFARQPEDVQKWVQGTSGREAIGMRLFAEQLLSATSPIFSSDRKPPTGDLDLPPDQGRPGGPGSNPTSSPPGRSPAGSSPSAPPPPPGKIGRGRNGQR